MHPARSDGRQAHLHGPSSYCLERGTLCPACKSVNGILATSPPLDLTGRHGSCTVQPGVAPAGCNGVRKPNGHARHSSSCSPCISSVGTKAMPRLARQGTVVQGTNAGPLTHPRAPPGAVVDQWSLMDGGFWLVGLKRVRAVSPGLVRGVAWSMDRALAGSVASLSACRIAFVDRLRDVDCVEDLAMTLIRGRASSAP